MTVEQCGCRKARGKTFPSAVTQFFYCTARVLFMLTIIVATWFLLIVTLSHTRDELLRYFDSYCRAVPQEVFTVFRHEGDYSHRVRSTRDPQLVNQELHTFSLDFLLLFCTVCYTYATHFPNQLVGKHFCYFLLIINQKSVGSSPFGSMFFLSEDFSS